MVCSISPGILVLLLGGVDGRGEEEWATVDVEGVRARVGIAVILKTELGTTGCEEGVI